MTNFTPGKIIKHFKTDRGKEAVIRYPKWEDLEGMIRYINEVSMEDIYITFSGEKIEKEGEMYYLSEMIKSMELQNSVYTTCHIDNILVGTCSIGRDLQSRKRSYHVGIFGITIARDFRSDGIGENLANASISEAKEKIPGLKILTLNVFEPNVIAQNLYKKLGFVQYAKLPNGVWYKDNYVDEIKMYLKL